MSRKILQYADRTDREILAKFSNTWLFPWEIKKAREVAAEGSDAECAFYLDELDRKCVWRLGEWKNFQ